MELNGFYVMMQPAIDQELRNAVSKLAGHKYNGLAEIIAYQLGWEGEGAGPEAQGKRLRPILVTLAADAVRGKWETALPAAAAVELLHNFSLIHDDIEDASPTRRGRPTVWSRWGQALAINAGDALYALAFAVLERLEITVNTKAALKAYSVLSDTSLRLTGGQHLDISYEEATSLPLDSYWSMVAGKTASLLAACMRLGAICAEADLATENSLWQFGFDLGLGFQIQDDWLGIWGNENITGKSKASDLITGKKTLPVLYGLQQDPKFASEWARRTDKPVNIENLAQMMIDNGAEAYTLLQAKRYLNQAVACLDKIELDPAAGSVLRQLPASLINRSS